MSNILMVCNWVYPIVKGVLGPGFFSICINSLAALVACSVVDNLGVMRRCGKNSTTSDCI